LLTKGKQKYIPYLIVADAGEFIGKISYQSLFYMLLCNLIFFFYENKLLGGKDQTANLLGEQ
jgi:hypothetical protein